MTRETKKVFDPQRGGEFSAEHLMQEGGVEPERYELFEGGTYRFKVNRRQFVQMLGAGILISVGSIGRAAEDSGPRFAPRPVSERLHIGTDGMVTVMTGKVEVGQGARTEVGMAAAEELRLPMDRIRVTMADTDLTPNDGGTFGSMTTPRTVPMVRRQAAAAHDILLDLGARRLKLKQEDVVARNGRIEARSGDKSVGYGELAEMYADEMEKDFAKDVTGEVEVRAVDEWEILGASVLKPTAREIVTGAHKYPSDIFRPGMLYGAVLRAPTYTGKLIGADLDPAREFEGVVPVRDGDFVGCAGPTSKAAADAVKAIAETARWSDEPHPSSDEVFDVLRENAHMDSQGWPRPMVREAGDPAGALKNAGDVMKATYRVPYIQHVPLEPRAAVAEWKGNQLTVWTGSQVPTGVRFELARAFNIPNDNVRVIIPDTGGGFGGKHTGECAVEAARLAREADRPVSLRWTREEEFTWAYFRPAGVIDISAGIDDAGKIDAWEFTNINSGAAALGTPYAIPNVKTTFMASDSPLREGSYRALAATANNFARESMMDEIAAANGEDPLAFRLRHLEDERLRAVLETAAKEFGWEERRTPKHDRAAGLACGHEKDSYVAACVEIEFDKDTGEFRVVEIVEAFECGAILNPRNLRAQVEGCVIMGLGGALTEEIEFSEGEIRNASFGSYTVPRMQDVPKLRTVLVDRPDLRPVGAGETPIIAVAPAIGNAVYTASGVRLRRLPMRRMPVEQMEPVAAG